jgi:hypothetical protein
MHRVAFENKPDCNARRTDHQGQLLARHGNNPYIAKGIEGLMCTSFGCHCQWVGAIFPAPLLCGWSKRITSITSECVPERNTEPQPILHSANSPKCLLAWEEGLSLGNILNKQSFIYVLRHPTTCAHLRVCTHLHFLSKNDLLSIVPLVWKWIVTCRSLEWTNSNIGKVPRLRFPLPRYG